MMDSDDEIKRRKTTNNKKSRKITFDSDSSLSDINDKVQNTLDFIEKSYEYLNDTNEENKTPNLPQSENKTKLKENSKVAASGKSKNSANKRTSSDTTSKNLKSAKKCKTGKDIPRSVDKKEVVDKNQTPRKSSPNQFNSKENSTTSTCFNQSTDLTSNNVSSSQFFTDTHQTQKITTPENEKSNKASNKTLSMENNTASRSQVESPDMPTNILSNQSSMHSTVTDIIENNKSPVSASRSNLQSPKTQINMSSTDSSDSDENYERPTPSKNRFDIRSSSSSTDTRNPLLSTHMNLKSKFNEMNSSTMPTNQDIKDLLDKQTELIKTSLREIVTIKLALKKRETMVNLKIEVCNTKEEFLKFEENLKDVEFQEKVVR